MLKKIIFIIFIFTCPPAAFSPAAEWHALNMLDYQGHIFLSSSELATGRPPQLGSYSMANLFDQRLDTCWAEGAADNGRGSELIFALPPGTKSIALANGYQKSRQLFLANNRIATLKISILVAINPPGAVTETHTLMQTVPFPGDYTVTLQDSMGFQQIPITVDWPDLTDFAKLQEQKYRRSHQLSDPLEVYYLAKLILKTTFSGAKYNDTCLSEIKYSAPARKISRIYLNATEDTILLATANKKDIVLNHAPDAVFQIISTTPDNNWLVVIKMAANSAPRAETFYELYNTGLQQKIPPSLLGNKVGEMYDFEMKKGEPYLTFLNKQNMEIEELALAPIQAQLSKERR